ncbi:RBBP8 N-terminal-like protein isoform X1 [Cygnus olor]|uniref:RBBP8 N-terminal-like protein isoform X1 n=1 Tax=Cygnus olor TaxID=8869 RepID=UPI001ADDF124|nr:RBBP8 N-terminal-like protein isoform X1 [Cygnus olor]XP_040432012.1 RBBP8 N-terminal-like protein isoform X1 [Cygnus olor]
MTTDTFAEFLNKLKEIHEKEVQGLQSKLTELTTEKCRDAQRIEELFAKNHQLREQQKVLKENVKVLENRLRAGLCDRCMVTQELAKKKQNEYETSHFQSLQHIFILTNEMSRLKEENKTLKEELKRLQSLEDRTKCPGAISRESSSAPSSPLALLSPASRNASSERGAPRAAEETHHDVPGLELGEEKPAGQRSSPSSRISPSTVLQEASLAETASQRISNQLHGTIALVRPGSRPCLLEKSPSGAAVSPPARKTPLPLERERSPSLEPYLTATKPDSPKLASSYETLKLTARKEQLCLLNRHFSLHQLGLAGNCALADRDGSFPSHLLRAKDGEGRMRPPDDWDDRAALLKLPAAVVYMRDQHLEGKLHLLKHRERLQHLLLHQRQQSQRARAESDPKSVPEERPLSPWPSIMGGCKEERSFLEDAVDGKEEKELWLSRDVSEHREKVEAGRDYGADVPLDLSDAGRGREAGWRDCREPREAGSPRPSPRGSPMHGPCGRHGMEQDGSRPPSRWPNTPRAPLAEQHGAAKEEEEEEEQEEEAMLALSRTHPTSKPTLSDPEALTEPRVRLAASAHKGEADDDDAESGQQESDEADTTDSEVAAPCEHDVLQEAQAEGKYFCTKDRAHGLQKKRKRGQDPWTKAGSKKSMRGRKKVKAEQCSAGITEEPENCSAASHDASEKS